MLFGAKPQAPAANANQATAKDNVAGEGAIIFDVGAADFEARVLQASMQKPVIVDFWAPWCGPCKQLMPVLEKAVTAAKGDVLLAKINIDDNPELASALRVQSVPTVFAFIGGRPVDAFQGAQPESQIKAFVAQLAEAMRAAQPGALDVPEALKTAAQILAAGDAAGAQSIYAQILQQEEKNVQAYIGLVRAYIAADELPQAEGLVQNAPPEIANSPSFSEAKNALELAKSLPEAAANLAPLLEKAQKNPKDQQAKIDLADAQFAAGQKAEALETLLESIAQDKDWSEQAARKALLRFFDALGHADPLTIAARKRLSTLLFS